MNAKLDFSNILSETKSPNTRSKLSENKLGIRYIDQILCKFSFCEARYYASPLMKRS